MSYPPAGPPGHHHSNNPQSGPPGYPGFAPNPAYPGPAGSPPRRPRTGLWVGLGAVVLVAFLITGLVAPGFLVGGSTDRLAGEQAGPTEVQTSLADPEPDSTEPQTSQPATSSSAGAAGDSAAGLALLQGFLGKVATGKSQDQDAAAAMGCPSYRARVEAFAIFGSGERYSYDLAQATRTGNDVAVSITGTMNGLPYSAVVTATTENGKSCVKVAETR